MRYQGKLLQVAEDNEFTPQFLESMVGTDVKPTSGKITKAWIEDGWLMVEVEDPYGLNVLGGPLKASVDPSRSSRPGGW